MPFPKAVYLTHVGPDADDYLVSETIASPNLTEVGVYALHQVRPARTDAVAADAKVAEAEAAADTAKVEADTAKAEADVAVAEKLAAEQAALVATDQLVSIKGSLAGHLQALRQAASTDDMKVVTAKLDELEAMLPPDLARALRPVKRRATRRRSRRPVPIKTRARKRRAR